MSEAPTIRLAVRAQHVMRCEQMFCLDNVAVLSRINNLAIEA
jgi:hypothetical protein